MSEPEPTQQPDPPATTERAAPSPLLPVDDALAIVVREAMALRERHPPATRVVGLWDASGYVLAEDVVADRDQPGFPKAMMDGYAVRAADVGADGAALRIVGEVAAGHGPERALEPGEAMAIMTGAPVPDGADAVQMVENTRREPGADEVFVKGPLAAGAHVSPIGEIVREGAVCVERGRVIESLTAGVLGSVGKDRLTVYRRPRVMLMTTGDELVALDAEPGPHQIRDSNRRTMMALLEREWCRVVDGGIVPDDLGAIKRAIRGGLDSEVLVLSGGVSAGVYDLVAEALADEGVDIVFHKVRIKPGKPLLFGRHANGLVFGLPGNPVSAFVTAMVFLAPAVRILGHRPDHRAYYVQLPLDGTLPAPGGRTAFIPGALVREDGDGMRVRALAHRGSADHIGFARANVLIRQEAGSGPVGAGASVRVLLPHSPTTW